MTEKNWSQGEDDDFDDFDDFDYHHCDVDVDDDVASCPICGEDMMPWVRNCHVCEQEIIANQG